MPLSQVLEPYGMTDSTPIAEIPGFCPKIVHLEMWNIVIALKMWGHYWIHSKLDTHCDNHAVVHVTNSHKTKDPFLAICDRNIWLLTAKYDISLQIYHSWGKKNIQADLPSRLHSQCQKNQEVLQLMHCCGWDPVPDHMFKLDFYL